jgi:hypothetical protein
LLTAACMAVALHIATATASDGIALAHSPLAISVSMDSPAKLHPGVSVPVAVTLTNAAPHRLDLNPDGISGTLSNLPAGCRSSWFRFAEDSRTAVSLTANGGTATVGGTLTFVDAETDQTACAGAALTLNVAVG